MPERLPPQSTTRPNPRAVVVALPPRDKPEERVAASLAELRRLLRGLGVDVVHELVQRRDDERAHLGPGKLRELARLTGGPGVVTRGPPGEAGSEPETETEPDAVPAAEPIADLVVVDADLSPAEERRLAAALGVDVMDRTGTILRVFERRAQTREAKIEIEMARLRHDVARTREVVGVDDREGGGGRGERGHSNVELAKQRMHKRLAELRRQLDAARSVRDRTRQRRDHVASVALVGYTNAGKSSLMRGLTHSEVLVDDLLFATLDTTVRAIPDTSPRVLVTDTVGFLEDLPHDLIASFRSTLEETAHAALVLYVLDASDPRMQAHLRVTQEALADLGLRAPSLVVLNKIDRVDPDTRAQLHERFPDALAVSALDPGDVTRLREAIVAGLRAEMVEADLVVPYDRGELLGQLHAQAHVLHEDYGEAGVAVTVHARPEVLARVRRALR